MSNTSVSVWASGISPSPKPRYRIQQVTLAPYRAGQDTRFHVQIARWGLGGTAGWKFDSSWDTYPEAVARIRDLTRHGTVTTFDAAGNILDSEVKEQHD